MQQISSKDEARMSTEGQDIKNAIQSPKSAVVSTGDVQNAIIDLRRLGLSFIDIYKQSGINPDFLIDAYTLVGFPVPISLRIELAAERLKAGRAGFAASSRIDQTGSSASSASHTNELLTPHLPSPHSSSNSQARFPKFGSDRWSTKFRLELSEEEDEDDSNDYDRYDEDDNYDNVRTDSSQSASNTPVISAPGRTDTHTSAKNALELKLQEIRKMTALVKELEAKKSAAEKELINSTASGSLEVVDNSRVHTMDAPQSISEHTEDLSVAHHELPLQEIAPESLNTHTKSPLQSMHTLSHIPNSANSVSEDSFKSIKDSLKQILERQDLILKQKKELKKHLENFQVRQLEKELDDLREEVERKKGKIDEITVQASLIEHRLSVTEEEENKISKILEELQNKILTTPIVKDTTRTNSHVNSVSTDNVYTERDEKQNIHDLGIISENDQNTIQLTANNMSPVEVNESSSFDEVNSLSQSAEATDLTEVDMKEGHITGNGDIEHETGNEIILSQQSNQDSNDNFALLTDHNLSNSDSPVISGQDASEMLSYGLENSIKTIGYDNATIKPEIKDQFDNTPMDITKVENSLVKRKVLDLELDNPELFEKYQSPLKRFKSYIFSPLFSMAVGEAGYRSKTYYRFESNDLIVCSRAKCRKQDCSFLHLDRLRVSDQEIMQRMVNAFVGTHKKDMELYKRTLVEFLSSQSDIPFEQLAPRLAEFRRSYTNDGRFLDWNLFENLAKESSLASKETNE